MQFQFTTFLSMNSSFSFRDYDQLCHAAQNRYKSRNFLHHFLIPKPKLNLSFYLSLLLNRSISQRDSLPMNNNFTLVGTGWINLRYIGKYMLVVTIIVINPVARSTAQKYDPVGWSPRFGEVNLLLSDRAKLSCDE
jgi:hypothetical protein